MPISNVLHYVKTLKHFKMYIFCQKFPSMCQKSNVFGIMTHIVNQSISRVEKNVFNKRSNKDKMKFQNKYISKYIYICTFNKMWLFVHRKFDINKK